MNAFSSEGPSSRPLTHFEIRSSENEVTIVTRVRGSNEICQIVTIGGSDRTSTSLASGERVGNGWPALSGEAGWLGRGRYPLG